MKKLIGIILVSFAMASVGQAATLVFSGVMASSPAATSTATYTQDVNAVGGDIIGAQVVFASATVPSVTFKDGSVSTFTLTVVSTTGITGAKATNTITVSNNSGLNAAAAVAKVSIASNTTTALNASTLTIVETGDVLNATYTIVGGRDYTVGTSSNATAIALAAAINSQINGVLAAVSPVGGSTVTITNDLVGRFGNSWTLTTSTAAALPVVSFSGGQTTATFTLNGIEFKAGRDFFVDVSFSSNTAVAIANVITADGGYGVTAATTAATVVTLTALKTGTYGNAFTLVASTTALAIGSGTFINGQNSASINIGGIFMTSGVDWPVPLVASTTANVATAIAAAINANTTLNTVFVAQAFGSLVTSTTSIVGANYVTATSTQAALTLSPFTSSSPVTGIATGSSFGGTAANYTINTPTITVTNHGLYTGNQLFFSTGSAVGLSPLVVGTTYFIIRLDANSFELATTSTGALAGTFITFTSSRTLATADSFTLNAIPLTGTALFTLQASNDNVNYQSVTAGENGVTISPTSFATPYTASSTNWAVGTFPWRYLRLLYTGPTFGAVNFTFYVNEKTSSSAR